MGIRGWSRGGDRIVRTHSGGGSDGRSSDGGSSNGDDSGSGGSSGSGDSITKERKSDVKTEKEEQLDNGGGNGGGSDGGNDDDDGDGSGGAGQPSRPRRRGQRHCSASFDTFTENYATVIDATVVSSAFFESLQNRSIAAPFQRIFVARWRASVNV